MRDTQILIVWIYTALLILGGVIGFVKASSKASLIMSIAFAIPLALAALGILPALVATTDIGFLFVFFSIRYAKSKKIMPGGMMALLSLITLAALFVFQK